MNRYTITKQVDTALAKSLQLSEVSQIARTEARLYKFFTHEWNMLAEQAVDLGYRKAAAGGNSEDVNASVSRIMRRWPKLVRKIYLEEMERVYILSRTAGHKKATRRTTSSLQYSATDTKQLVTKAKPLPDTTSNPALDESDREIMDLLMEMGVKFVDDHYDMNMEDAVADSIRQELAAGEVTGSFRDKLINSLMIMSAVGAWKGPIRRYFEGLLANSFSTIRMAGQLRSMMEIGITHFTISVTDDERLCPRCAWMDGKVFSVEDGARTLSSIVTSQTLGELKSAQPWLNMSQIRQISTGPGFQRGTAGLRDTRNLADASFILPPYHFRCRCTVDIATETNIFEQLQPITFTVGLTNITIKE